MKDCNHKRFVAPCFLPEPKVLQNGEMVLVELSYNPFPDFIRKHIWLDIVWEGKDEEGNDERIIEMVTNQDTADWYRFLLLEASKDVRL